MSETESHKLLAQTLSDVLQRLELSSKHQQQQEPEQGLNKHARVKHRLPSFSI